MRQRGCSQSACKVRELLLSLSAEVSVAATAPPAGLIDAIGGLHGAVGRGQGVDELSRVQSGRGTVVSGCG